VRAIPIRSRYVQCYLRFYSICLPIVYGKRGLYLTAEMNKWGILPLITQIVGLSDIICKIQIALRARII